MSEKRQTGTKLANSVRQAKMKQSGQGTPAVQSGTRAEEDKSIAIFPSRRVWPD